MTVDTTTITVPGRISRIRSAVSSAVTPLGWILAGLLVAAVVVVRMFGWVEAAVLAAMVFALLAVAIAFTLGRVDLETSVRVEPSRVVVGGTAKGQLWITNKRHRAARRLRIELPVGQAVGVYALPALAPDASIDEIFNVPTNRRAVIPVGPATTVKGDPLGIMRHIQTWGEVEEIYVHPKTVAVSTVAAGLIRDMEGQQTSQLSPSDVAFHTLRDYVPGDELRHVHWKSTAKRSDGKLLVRQYVDTRRSNIAVLLSVDLDEYQDEDEFELGVSCAASVATQAIRDEQTVSVMAGSGRLMGSTVKPLLDRFSGVEGMAGEGGIETALKAMRSHIPDASVVVLCTGGTTDVTGIQGAVRKAGVEQPVIVLRAAFGSKAGFQNIGSHIFFNIPELARLGAAMDAVTI